MANPNEVQSLTANKSAQSSAVSGSGQMMFSNPYESTVSGYSPSTDKALQNLATSGHANLASDLTQLYTSVSGGQLSAGAYREFEGASLALANSGGSNFSNDSQLESTAFNSIQGSLTNDSSTLNQLISGSKPAAAAYNPTNDAQLQNLSNTGDSQLKNTLLNAYQQVQAGNLSFAGYQQFENSAIPLTDYDADIAKGLNFSTDTPLEQYALKSIQSNLSNADAGALNQLVSADASANGGGTIGSPAGGGTGGGSSPTTGGDGTTMANGAAPIDLTTVEHQQNNAYNTTSIGGPVNDIGYGYVKGASPGYPSATMPPNSNESVSWMVAYPMNGTAETPGSSIDVANMNEYALMKDGTWKPLSQSNGNTGDWIELNPNNMQGISGTPALQFNTDGSMMIPAAPDGQVSQFGGPGASFNASDIQGIYVSAQVKGTAGSNTAVQIGADFYGNQQYLGQVGNSNWLAVTPQYQTITMTNIPDSVLEANTPPPGVTAS